MGWLRGLMAGAHPPLRSFGVLARRALGHADWPSETRPEARSLASLLSKLDRGQELGWLEERPDVQAVLAELLGRAPDDLRVAWSPGPSPPHAALPREAPARVFRFDDVPFARALDLVTDELPPGLPALLERPATWGRLVWWAPSGSGRTLAGRWLEARGLATLVRAASASEAMELAPSRGAVFVELARADLADDLDAFAAFAAERPLCVALPPGLGTLPAGWSTLETPSAQSFARDLVEWIALRLPRDGRFDPETAYAWIERGPLAEGIVDGFGTLLGLCGLVDEVGVRALRGRSLADNTRTFVTERLGRAATKGSASAAWLKRPGFDMLVMLARRLVVHDDADLGATRSLEAWLEAVPAEHRRGPDVEWLRVALSHERDSLRPADIERAARHVPPGAFRIVRGLEAAGLLRPSDGQGLALAPRFLVAVLRREARRDLVLGSGLDWGQALLRPRLSVEIAAALHERIEREEGGAIDEVLDIEGDRGPELALAVEACFRSSGTVLLAGGELSSELIEALWDEALSYLVELPGELPRPRVEHPSAVAAASWLLAPASYYLGALALSERLADSAGASHELLRPWTRTQPPPALAELFDRIARDLVLAPPLVQSSAFALVDRLRRTIGASGAPPHVLEQPGIVLDEIEHEVLAWASVIGLERHPLGVPALLALAQGRGIGQKQVARALWQAWDAAGQPEVLLFSAPNALSDFRNRSAIGGLLAKAPPRLLVELLSQSPVRDLVTWGEVESDGWRALAQVAFAEQLLPDAAWNALPEPLAREALAATSAARPIAEAAARALWRRFPQRVAQRLAETVVARDETVFIDLLRTAPRRATPEVTRALEAVEGRGALLELPETALHALRRALQASVAERAPGHVEAYGLLDRIESALAPARAHRSSRPPF